MIPILSSTSRFALPTSKRLALALLLAALCASTPAMAQAPGSAGTATEAAATPAAAPADAPQATPAEAMAKLGFLLGRWQGEGSMRMGPGEPKLTQVTEHVYPKLGGVVVVLEGLGTVPGSAGEPPTPVHEAFGVLAWDAATGKYLMRAFRADGQFVDAEVEVGDDRLIWGFVSPRGHVRYTINLDAEGRWQEIGEFSRDGAAWSGFFEMNLTRTGDG